MLQDYPPSRIAHAVRCPWAGIGFVIRIKGLEQHHPNARPHTCVTDETRALNRLVVAVPASWPAHKYEPSQQQYDLATRPWCVVCGGTHPEEF